MQLYAGSSRDFITDATRNQIAGKLRSAFVDTYHAEPSRQEVQSWQNSLLQMANALQTGSPMTKAFCWSINWGQLATYRKATGATRALLVMMTTGRVIELT